MNTVWNTTYSGLPSESGHFVAIFNDGSGAGLFTVLDGGEIIDAQGDSVDGFYLVDTFALWTYLPPTSRLWYQITADETLL